MRERGDAVGRAGVDHAAVMLAEVVLGHRVQEDVHVGGDVQVRGLERASQREYQRHVFRDMGNTLVRDKMGRRSGGEAAGQRDIVVDVELEEVVEGVGYKLDGAI